VIKVKGLNQKGFCLKIKVLIKSAFIKKFQFSAKFKLCQNLKNLLKKLSQKLEKFKPFDWN
jgi:hypothetical protein